MERSLSIAQSARYIGDRWWSFSVWIEGPDEDLDRVESVDYFLHPTFRNPMRTRRRREDKFRLSSRCRGEFTLTATIRHKGGASEKLSYDLSLEPPEGKATAPHENPVVFLTGSAADRSSIDALERALKRRRVSVVTMEKLGADAPDLPFEEIMERALTPADGAVVFSTPKPNLWMRREIQAIQKHDVPMTVINMGSKGLPASLEKGQTIEFADAVDVGEFATELASKLRSGFSS